MQANGRGVWYDSERRGCRRDRDEPVVLQQLQVHGGGHLHHRSHQPPLHTPGGAHLFPTLRRNALRSLGIGHRRPWWSRWRRRCKQEWWLHASEMMWQLASSACKYKDRYEMKMEMGMEMERKTPHNLSRLWTPCDDLLHYWIGWAPHVFPPFVHLVEKWGEFFYHGSQRHFPFVRCWDRVFKY